MRTLTTQITFSPYWQIILQAKYSLLEGGIKIRLLLYTSTSSYINEHYNASKTQNQ